VIELRKLAQLASELENPSKRTREARGMLRAGSTVELPILNGG
jgi:hypothetical protein